MLFFVGGVPAPIFPRFQGSVAALFGGGHRIISTPQREIGGKYAPSSVEGARLLGLFCNQADKNMNSARSGCGLIVLKSAGVDVRKFVELFKPFALPVQIDLPMPLTLSNSGQTSWFDELARRVRTSLPPLREALRVTGIEFTARLKSLIQNYRT